MFHIINEIEGVYEIWWQEDSGDLVWTWVSECDTLDAAREEVAAMEAAMFGESYISHD